MTRSGYPHGVRLKDEEPDNTGFHIMEKLGEGAYSSVHKVKRRNDGKIYALKKVRMVDLSDKEKENALNEVRILASIKSPNIISYKEAFVDDPTQSLWYFLFDIEV